MCKGLRAKQGQVNSHASTAQIHPSVKIHFQRLQIRAKQPLRVLCNFANWCLVLGAWCEASTKHAIPTLASSAPLRANSCGASAKQPFAGPEFTAELPRVGCFLGTCAKQGTNSCLRANSANLGDARFKYKYLLVSKERFIST